MDIDGDADQDAFITSSSVGHAIFLENKPCKLAHTTNQVQKHQNEFLGKESINTSAVVRSGRSVHFSGKEGIIFNEAFEVKQNAQLVADNEGCKN
jgi:hypothetical protein